MGHISRKCSESPALRRRDLGFIVVSLLENGDTLYCLSYSIVVGVQQENECQSICIFLKTMKATP